MKRLVVTLLFGLIALPGAARAEDPVGCALTSAPLMAQPDGSILIGCTGGLTDPFGEQLVNVLNKMLQSTGQVWYANVSRTGRLPSKKSPSFTGFPV